MKHWMLVTGALSGALAVAAGAFGAHALQDMLAPRALEWYGTASSYQTTHAIALIFCAFAAMQVPKNNRSGFHVAGLCFLAGSLIFSGSLYVMAFTGITQLGMITPVGGVLFILGWLLLALGARKIPSTSEQEHS